MIKMALSLLAGSFVFGSIFTAPAVWAKEPPLGCAASPWEMSSAQWDVGQDLPKFVNKQKLIAALHPNGDLLIPPKDFEANQKCKNGEALVGVGVKSWPYEKGTYVALLETEMRKASGSGGYDSLYNLLYAAKIKQNGNSFDVSAISEPIKLAPKYHFNKFDFANYKINQNHTAFGLQTCHISAFSGPGAPSKSVAFVNLIRQSGQKLEKILSTSVLYETQPQKHFDLATIETSKNSTNSFNDLTKTFRGKKTTFKWQGHFYSTSDKDTFRQFLARSGCLALDQATIDAISR